MLSPQKEELIPQKQQREIKPPLFIETENLSDVARLVCALERAPLPLFSINNDGKNLIASQLDLFLGTPVFYFAYSNEIKHYLGYRTIQNGEEVTLVDTQLNSALVHAPIIQVTKVPSVFERGLLDLANSRAEEIHQKFLSLEVKDLTSLVKVASYKMLFEEPPLPIFVFPFSKNKNNRWCVGCFTRIEDYEEASIFFYYEEQTKPEQNFVKYSMNKPDAAFTNKTDEHGNVYIKVIRLKHSHPLVQL